MNKKTNNQDNLDKMPVSYDPSDREAILEHNPNWDREKPSTWSTKDIGGILEGKDRKSFDDYFYHIDRGYREESEKVVGEFKEDLETKRINHNDYHKNVADETTNLGRKLEELTEVRKQVGENLGFLDANGDTDVDSNSSGHDSSTSTRSGSHNGDNDSNNGDNNSNASNAGGNGSPIDYVVEQESTEPMDIIDPDG